MAKGRLPNKPRHAHRWSYDDTPMLLSDDDQVIAVARFCYLCGVREVGDLAWRKPTETELSDILQDEARRDAHPRRDLDDAYDSGFCEAVNQVQATLDRMKETDARDGRSS